jgi:hypothetical protein
MLAAQRILKSAIACSSRTVSGFAEGAVTIFHVRFTPKSGHVRQQLGMSAMEADMASSGFKSHHSNSLQHEAHCENHYSRQGP